MRKKERTKQREQHTPNPSNLDGALNPEGEAEADTQGTEHAEHKKEQPMRLREVVGTAIKRSSLTDWLLVLFTFVLAGASIYQFVIMRGQLREMTSANVISQGNLDIERETLRISQGPQVYVTRTTMSALKAGQKAVAAVEVKNFGHLAGESFIIGAYVDSRPGDPILTLNFNNLGNGSSITPEVPTITKFYSQDPLSESQVKNISNGKENLYVYSVIQYESPLARGILSETVSCSKYDPSRDDRLMIGCPYAPQLSINGKPLLPTYELQGSAGVIKH